MGSFVRRLSNLRNGFSLTRDNFSAHGLFAPIYGEVRGRFLPIPSPASERAPAFLRSVFLAEPKSVDLEAGLLRLVRAGNDLTARQLVVLFACRKEKRTVRWLADHLGVSKPAVSRAVDRLADTGYAGRLDDPEDRRSVLVALTRTGERFLAGVLDPKGV